MNIPLESHSHVRQIWSDLLDSGLDYQVVYTVLLLAVVHFLVILELHEGTAGYVEQVLCAL